jgi:hypothetical protein
MVLSSITHHACEGAGSEGPDTPLPSVVVDITVTIMVVVEVAVDDGEWGIHSSKVRAVNPTSLQFRMRPMPAK